MFAFHSTTLYNKMPKKDNKAKANERHQQIARPDEKNATELSSNIRCDASVTNLLIPAMIKLANYVVKHLNSWSRHDGANGKYFFTPKWIVKKFAFVNS